MYQFDNLTVLSLEQATVVPYLTYRLAMDGIEIIRIEHPTHGDPNRMIGDNILDENHMNTYFLCINGGKKSLTLDLSSNRGKEIFLKIISKLKIDIFITNQLPKNYKKLGIDYSTLKSVKKDIIWLGVTGFGPNSNEGAYDPILQARSGLMDLTGEPDGSPQVLGIPLPDMGTSEHAYGLVMKALYKRETTGEGSRIDLSMFESSVSWLTVPIAMQTSFGKNITRLGNTHEFFCPVSVYPTKDAYVYIAVGNDRQWKKFVEIEIFNSLNLKEYELNSGRIKNVGSINKSISKITSQHKSSELLTLLKKITVPISKIQSISDIIEDISIKNKFLYTVDPKTNRKVTLAPAPNTTHFLKENGNKLTFPPRYGEHNNEILKKIGCSAEKIKVLKKEKII